MTNQSDLMTMANTKIHLVSNHGNLVANVKNLSKHNNTCQSCFMTKLYDSLL